MRGLVRLRLELPEILRRLDLQSLRIRLGFGRGSREMGVPTANLDVPQVEAALAGRPHGVYFGFARVLGAAGADGDVHPMVLNLGQRPTFADGDGLSVEAHLLHTFGADFYGRSISVKPAASDTKNSDAPASRSSAVTPHARPSAAKAPSRTGAATATCLLAFARRRRGARELEPSYNVLDAAEPLLAAHKRLPRPVLVATMPLMRRIKAARDAWWMRAT